MSTVKETYVIHVTKKCNCDCYYCYEDDKYSRYTWNEIKELIDDIIKYRTSDSFHIEFLGGEPMLEWELIKKSYEYIESHKELDVRYIITTNGTVLTDDALDYLSKNNKFKFAVSMDGHKWSNQLRVFKKSRENTYDTCIKNLKKIKEKGIRYNIHMVIHQYNVPFIYESIFHLYELGFNEIVMGIIEKVYRIDKHYADLYIEQMKKVSDRIVEDELYDLHIGEFNWLKPREDIRTYIKDDSGKVIGETYGRSGSDITDKEDSYNISKITDKSEVFELIHYIRESIYNYHQTNLKR